METEMPNLDGSIFKIDQPNNRPSAGSILVAEPFLREEYFNHGVIALVEYSPGHKAMGLVLNKPTGYTLGEAVDGIHDEVDVPIFCGGPLSCDRLFYLHNIPDEFDDSREIYPGLYIGGDFEQVKDYLNMGFETEGKMRFFVGYSGWDAMQLEEEIRNHVWAVAPRLSDEELFRNDGEALWYHIVRKLGQPYRNWLYHPLNPQYN